MIQRAMGLGQTRATSNISQVVRLWPKFLYAFITKRYEVSFPTEVSYVSVSLFVQLRNMLISLQSQS